MSISKSKVRICIYLLLFVFFPSKVAYMDASHPWQLGFQDPATPIMEGIIFFNGLLMTFMLFIACFVGWLLYQSLTLFDEASNAEPESFNHSTLLEVVWTIIPAGILMIISVPSYNLLYAMEEVIDPSLTIKVVGHQWYWSYECSDFEVSPKVTQNNLESIEKSFNTLKEWIDLIEYAEINIGVNEKSAQVDLLDSMLNKCSDDEIKDSTLAIKKLISLSDAGLDSKEEKDVRYVGLSRSQREAYLAEAELDRAKEESVFAEEELEDADLELSNANSNSKWASIDLSAAKVNKASAASIKAHTESAVTSPSLIRSRLLLEEGFDGWTEELRVKTKEISDVAKAALIKAKEEFKSAKAVLNITSLELTPEEVSKAKAIAESAEVEFTAVEEEVLSVESELSKSKDILQNAELELKTFSVISDRADKRLARAQAAFDSAKCLSNRTRAEVNGAKIFFDQAMADLTGSKIKLDNTFVSINDVFDKTKISFDTGNDTLKMAKEEFNNSEMSLDIAKAELIRSEARLETVKGYVDKTTMILDDTPLMYEEDRDLQEPVVYFDNFTWEIHNRDLLVVEAQLRSAKDELLASQIAFNSAKANTAETIENLIEAELKVSKIASDFAKVKIDKLEALYKLENSGILKKELDVLKTNSTKADKWVADIEFNIANIIYQEARLEVYRVEGPVDSSFANLLLDKARLSLLEAQVNKNKFDFVLDNSDSLSVLAKEDSVRLYSEYAEICLNKVKAELSAAESDYTKALNRFTETEKLLNTLKANLFKASNFLDKVEFDKHWSSYNSACANLEATLGRFKEARSSFSLLDIKLNPGFLETKAYTEVLLADAELDNAKWLCNRLSDNIDKSLSKVTSNNIEPSNILFSDSSDSSDSSPSSSPSSSESSIEGNNDDESNDKKSSVKILKELGKTNKDIKEMLYKIEKKEVSDSQVDLFVDILQTFKDLVETLDDSDVDSVRNLLTQFLPSIVSEDVSKMEKTKDYIDLVLDLISSPLEEKELSERQRINFDSYLIADDDLVIPEASGTGKAGKVFRLLEVDNRLFVPTNTHIRVLVTSADVLHSWAVPSLGVKVDACPGRLNQVFLFVKREGVFYGQCSELCGVNHGFMPIVVQAVSQDDYLTWVGKRLCS